VTAAAGLLGALLALPALAGGPEVEEAWVSLDARDAPVAEVVRVLVEAGGFQVVFDPDVRCRLTVRLQRAAWRSALDAALAACSLGVEDEAGVLRAAPVSRLREEARARRQLDAERAARPAGRLATFRLSHARAREMAPLLERTIGPSGRVSYDERTNTLIVSY
jgi:type II secretory pathway component HofQ